MNFKCFLQEKFIGQYWLVFALFNLTLLLTSAAWAESSRKINNTEQPQKTVEQIEKDFLDTTGLVPGMYELIDGPQSCQEGNLDIVRLDNEITLMLGAHPLVTGLGRSAYSVTERKCKSKISSYYDKGTINGQKITKCSKRPTTTYTVTVKISENTLEYVRTIREDKKTPTVINCKLKLQN